MLRLTGLLLAVGALGAAVAIAACGASEAAQGIPSDDGGPPDGNEGDGPEAGLGGNAVLAAVNASPDLGDVRFCLALGDTMQMVPALAVPDDPTQPMPESNYPGVAAGGGFVLPDLGDLSMKSVTFFAVRADQITDHVKGNPNARTCDRLICAQQDIGCLAQGQYFALPKLPAGSLLGGKTYVLALTGCMPAFFDSAATPARCGVSYDATRGNLQANPLLLGTPMSSPGKLSVQLVELAPALGAVTAQYGPIGADAGQEIASGVRYTEVSQPASVALPSQPPDYATTAFSAAAAMGGEAGAPIAIALSLAEVQKLSNPTALPMDFFGGVPGVALIVLGDPGADGPLLADGGANPAYRGYGLHLIAVPSKAKSTE